MTTIIILVSFLTYLRHKIKKTSQLYGLNGQPLPLPHAMEGEV